MDRMVRRHRLVTFAAKHMPSLNTYSRQFVSIAYAVSATAASTYTNLNKLNELNRCWVHFSFNKM